MAVTTSIDTSIDPSIDTLSLPPLIATMRLRRLNNSRLHYSGARGH